MSPKICCKNIMNIVFIMTLFGLSTIGLDSLF